MPEHKHILRCIAGQLEGQSFILRPEGTVIGRSPRSDIVVPNNLVSRSHARLRLVDGKWRVCDQDSANGTWLDAQPLRGEGSLTQEGRLRIGDCVFVMERSSAEMHSTLGFHFDPMAVHEQMLQSVEEVFELEHRRLYAIFKIMNALPGVQQEEQVHLTLLDTCLREIRGVLQGCIFLFDSGLDKLVPVRALGAGFTMMPPEQFLVNPEMLDYTFRKKEAADFESEGAHYLLAPLQHHRDILGVVCLRATTTFSRDDLEFLAGAAFSSAVLLVNCRLARKMAENERLAALGTTAASLSHYIKNILTGIDGCLYLMDMGINDRDTDIIREAFDILARNNKRLQTLVMDLLNLAKEGKLNFQMHSLSEILRDAAQLHRQSLANLRVELHMDPELNSKPFSAEVDAETIHRILLNLITNAMDALTEKFGGQTGGWIRLGAYFTADHHFICLAVADNGPGVPHDRHEKIFEIFYTGKGEAGTGLGLAVSRKLVKAHGGTLTLESRMGEGSTFTIKLPITRASGNTRLYIDTSELRGVRSGTQLGADAASSVQAAAPMLQESGYLDTQTHIIARPRPKNPSAK